MKEEVKALEDNNTWTLEHLPLGKRPIGCMWVYKVKFNSDGTVYKYKARLVDKGYNQQYGIDYVDTFDPIAKMVTVRVVLALGASKSWIVYPMDVVTAFL